MPAAQFRVVPPLARIALLFEAITAQALHHGACWSSWSTAPEELLHQFRPYIRPSHQQLLDSALAKPDSPAVQCSFLRQLLRPHHFKIEASRTGWRLISTDVSGALGVVSCKQTSVFINWD